MGKWGSGEVGKWGSGGISTKTLTPQHPNTLSPYHPITRLLTPNPMVDVGFLQEFYFPTKISKNY
ncbi:MAG: hypothetical protein EWV76_17230 [Microcystis novacekii Mn_MB_F_20050700_S1]|nr:MAG: hypothetical protein EWV76_17230 [Microcystis novacekii Mn_MB_F_20050700_S1]